MKPIKKVNTKKLKKQLKAQGFLEKQIFFDEKKFCLIKLYKTKKEMNKGVLRHRPDEENMGRLEGCHCPMISYNVDEQSKVTEVSPMTAIVFLHIDKCGAGLIAHELGHAVLWARNHSPEKMQYPIVISSMEEEEELLHNLTKVVADFYNWYWEVVDLFKKKRK